MEFFAAFWATNSIGEIASIWGAMLTTTSPFLVIVYKKLKNRSSASLVEERDVANRNLQIERDKVQTLQKTVGGLEKELVHARSLWPATWLNTARKERQEGNEVIAQKALLSGLESIAEDLSVVAIEMAEFYDLSRSYQQKTGLAQALRYAEIANRLRPDDKGCALYLVELLEAKNVMSFEDQSYALSVDEEQIIDQIFDVANPLRLSQVLLNMVDDRIDAEQYRGAYRLAIRAERVSARLGHEHEFQLIAQHYLACLLYTSPSPRDS